jgi:hypothetical protein
MTTDTSEIQRIIRIPLKWKRWISFYTHNLPKFNHEDTNNLKTSTMNSKIKTVYETSQQQQKPGPEDSLPKSIRPLKKN